MDPVMYSVAERLHDLGNRILCKSDGVGGSLNTTNSIATKLSLDRVVGQGYDFPIGKGDYRIVRRGVGLELYSVFSQCWPIKRPIGSLNDLVGLIRELQNMGERYLSEIKTIN